MFVHGKPFQPNLMFAVKAGLSLSGATERYFTWVVSWPHPQTLDKAGKACQRQILWLIKKSRNLRPQKVYSINTWSSKNCIEGFRKIDGLRASKVPFPAAQDVPGID